MTAKTITETVRADELRAYLAAHGLRVVRGRFSKGDKYVWLITGPALPAEAKADEAKGDETNGDE